jgi:hypothetical protein
VAVDGSQPLDGKISVWIAPDARIAQFLSTDGLDGAVVDMGGGRYVIELPTGSEVENVRKVRDTEGVYDAGRVFDEGGYTRG